MHKETEDTSATESVGSTSNAVVSEKKATKVAKKDEVSIWKSSLNSDACVS